MTEVQAWAIKLGSAGICVQFCEEHGIVGVGWKDVDHRVLATGTQEELWQHVKDRCSFYDSARAIGAATGQLFKFGRTCKVGDIVAYYDPPNKRVRICRATSDVAFRDFALDQPDVDIWHYRRVECLGEPIPILDFYGPLKGSLLIPRMSFWNLRDSAETLALLAEGGSPAALADPALMEAHKNLSNLLKGRAESLDHNDWELLVADYFRAQGAHVDERRIGGNQRVIDVEARFAQGELGDVVWRVQVKRWQNQQVDWPAIEQDFRHVGDAEFCYVSVFGFTEEARAKADEHGIRLLEAADFTRFLLSGRMRPALQRKLRLPFVGP